MRMPCVLRRFRLLIAVLLFAVSAAAPLHAVELPPIPELPGESEESELVVSPEPRPELKPETQISAADFFEICKSGSPEDVRSAIERGGDVYARNETGLTPLMHAAWDNENPEVLRLLLKAGADLEARENEFGMTALLIAAF